MAFKLNRIPAGLLSFFQVKSDGNNPNAIEESVRGVVDLAPFYWTDVVLKSVTASQTLVDGNDVGTAVAEINIPQNEIWAVMGVESFWTATATGSNNFIDCCPVIVWIGGAPASYYLDDGKARQSGAFKAQNVLDSELRGLQYQQPVMYPGGTRIASYVLAGNGTTAHHTVQTKLLYYPIER